MSKGIVLMVATALTLAVLPRVGSTQKAPVRRFLPIEWKKTVVLEGALDSELLKPALMVARDSTIYVYDYGDQAVKAFAFDGRLRWRFGRNGGGPGEFENPTDLQLDNAGSIWVADPIASRVTVIGSNGRLVRTLPLERPVERIMPQTAGRFLTFAFAGDKPRFERFDSLGRTRGQIRHPPWMDTLPSLVSELRLAVTPDGKQFAFGSFYSGRLMLLGADDSTVRDVQAIETHPFPKQITYSPRAGMTVRRLPPEARSTIRAMSADAESIYALIIGAHEARGRIIDRYRLRDGGYAGSWLLPERAHAISITSRGVVVLINDDLPALYYYERRTTR